MRWMTHQLAGLLVAEAVLGRSHPGPVMAVGCVAAALAGSIAPDLDHLGALFKRHFPGSSLGHRTFTHGLLGLGASAWLGRVLHLPSPVELAWAGAWAAHLAADCLTPEGCPLLWPLGHRLSLRLVRTGGGLETWIVRPALAVLVGITAVRLLR